jgi:purine-binding chemotaxis protein CheW
MPETESLRAVVFRVGGLVCALPATVVREILPPLRATRIPGADACVDGLVNVRGTLLTVVDAHRLAGQPRPDGGEPATLVVEIGERICGLAVSQVLDFVELPAGGVAPRAELPGVDPRLVRGVAAHGERHYILLDLDNLVTPVFGR